MCLQFFDSSKFSSFWLGWAKLGGPEQRNNSVSCRLSQEAVNLSRILESFYFKIFEISFWFLPGPQVNLVCKPSHSSKPCNFLMKSGEVFKGS